MKPDPNDFEALRKLMALKRHEQPPSDYLDGLSGNIMSRIERGEGRLSLFDRVSANFSARPTLVYACGLTICGALGLSAVYIARQGVNEAAANTGTVAFKAPERNPVGAYAIQVEESGAPPIHVAGWLRNTNPASDTLPAMSLFNTPHGTVQISYQPGN